ncbi:MAG: TIGR04283 family arsenosugar biosynthesis glycosyltransferase [Gammaproteobacteria bacterium]
MKFEPDSSILVLFCRKPSLGNGKQRIAREIGEPKALEIAELLLAAAAEDARQWDGPVVIAPANPGDHNWALRLIPGCTVIPQCEGNLGERIQHVDQSIRAAGGSKVIFIGSDAPGLSPVLISQAAENLQDSDIVLMPAEDGGVTLMGSRKPWPELSDLPWSTAQLGSRLTETCVRKDLSIGLLPGNTDIDTCTDLVDEFNRLETDIRQSRRDIATWIKSNLPHKQTLSVIIPVLHDLDALERLLRSLSAQTDIINEIVVVDGANSFACTKICEQHEAVHLPAEACRGDQLSRGADQSNGEILWFLHADSSPAPESAATIRKHMLAGANGGYFSFRFSGRRCWQKNLLETAINFRAGLGTPYGDQGLFMSRLAYEHAGGFEKLPLFEEVRLIKKLRNIGRFSGLQTHIGVSPRRWEREGWLKRTLHNRWLACAYMFGVQPEKLARQYNSGNALD